MSLSSSGRNLALGEHARPPRLMGVLNVTPDSFSDGGLHLDPARAIERGLELAAQGADYIDVGGESTRPGAEPVDAHTERSRIEPVVRGLARQTRVPISIDTTKASVAEAALGAGATIVNDISAGLFDAHMLPLVQRAGSGYVLMHMQGTPGNMQAAPEYADVVGEVLAFLRGRVDACLSAGIEAAQLWVDPGIGFGKTLDHNLTLLRRLRELKVLGLPILVGVSRKSFIGKVNARLGAAENPEGAHRRLGGTAAAVSACVQAGADCLRVHDVAVMAEAARVAFALGDSWRSSE